MGAWIETLQVLSRLTRFVVAPYVGAWIETDFGTAGQIADISVAPYVGAWIETLGDGSVASAASGRTLCGCVD